MSLLHQCSKRSRKMGDLFVLIATQFQEQCHRLEDEARLSRVELTAPVVAFALDTYAGGCGRFLMSVQDQKTLNRWLLVLCCS